MLNILSFDQALEIANKLKTSKDRVRPKHVLLGNGFSIACRSDIFTYSSLFKDANFSSAELKKLFDSFKTKDFELIIKKLQDSSKVINVYSPKNELIKRAKKDAEELKKELINVLCGKHPEKSSEIENYKYKSCAKFLSNFDKMYTLNYDLLLYWTIMHDKDSDKCIKKINDGFLREDEEFLHWDVENSNSQNIYYLHGALHLYDNGNDLIKIETGQYGETLMDQISQAVESDQYPLFVTEGSSKNKLAKINHSAYLSRCFKSFSDIEGSLFIYGHSLADNDNHILNLIAESNSVELLFIGLYGDKSLTENKAIIKKALSLKSKRENSKNNKSLEVYFYNSETAKVWHSITEEDILNEIIAGFDIVEGGYVHSS